MKETQNKKQSLSSLEQELEETRNKLRSQSYLNPLERQKMIAKIRLIKSTIAMLSSYQNKLNVV